MTRRRALIGAAIGAGFLGWAVRRNRRAAAHLPAIPALDPGEGVEQRSSRAGRCRVVLLPLLFAATVLAWPWDDVIDRASGIANLVKQLVKDALSELWNYINSAFDFLTRVFGIVYKVAGNIIEGLRDLVEHLVEGALRTALGWVLDVYKWIDVQAMAIYNDVRRWIDDAVNLARWAADYARGLVDGAVRWVIDNVLNPLLGAVAEVYRFVLGSIRDAIDVFWRNVVQPTIDLAHWLYNTVNDIIDFVERVAKPIFTVLGKAWWFIVFVAEHPLTWWKIILEEIAHRAPELWISGARRAFDQHGSEIEDAVTKWLRS